MSVPDHLNLLLVKSIVLNALRKNALGCGREKRNPPNSEIYEKDGLFRVQKTDVSVLLYEELYYYIAI